MKIFGFEITRAKSAMDATAVHSSRGWFSLIREAWGGAWQGAIERDAPQDILAFSAVFACVTGIARDVAKLYLRAVSENEGICTPLPATSPYSRVFARPNHFQNRIKFIEQWVISLLLWGNAYAVKRRDARGMVQALYLLHPERVTPLVTTSGDVYYRLATDHLAGLPDSITIPASEIIHDTMASLWHPLAGVSPIYACGMAATIGNKIQKNSAGFFANMSRPSGILTAEGDIPEETAKRLKKEFEEGFSGQNIGRIAVGGHGMKYVPMMIPAEDAQLIEQLKWTVEDVGRCFHYPLYKLGGTVPPGSTVETLNQTYYSECLQPIMESIELCMTEGLEMPPGYQAEFDLDGLLRMDHGAMAKTEEVLVGAGIKSPDEARRKFNLAPVPGGNTPYMQQQNFSLAALAKRDAREDPFEKAGGDPKPAPTMPAANDPDAEEAAAAQAREILAAFTKGLEHA